MITANLRSRHGFFTRQGGVSQGIYESLNGGSGSADAPAAVTENRARAAAALGAHALQTLHQIHSRTAVVMDAPEEPRPKADGIVTRAKGFAVAALAADCAPVLFEDPAAGVVAACHAGWKGALAGVTDATADAMEAEGARSIRAAIGPCIAQASYEVGPEFLDAFLEDSPDNARFFAQGKGDRLHFDLPGYLLARLRARGIEAEWTGHDTYADPARFFSYRRSVHRSEPDYGRLISAIVL